MGTNHEVSRLRELREGRGLPAVVLAHMAGLSGATVHYWEKWGIVPKSQAKRQAVADVLGVDLASIMPTGAGHGQ